MNARLRRRVRRGLAGSLVAAALLVLLANRWVINATDSFLKSNTALMPDNEVGMVLGCSPFARDGSPSAEFRGRIAAAAALYQQGKVKRLILSGSNPDSRYNEPKKMREALLEKGVPSDVMVLDLAGDSTFDSVVRAKLVHGLDRVTIVTQKYHAYRAVFLARKIGVRATAFIAPVDDKGSPGFRHPPREVLARLSAVFDLYLFAP